MHHGHGRGNWSREGNSTQQAGHEQEENPSPDTDRGHRLPPIAHPCSLSNPQCVDRLLFFAYRPVVGARERILEAAARLFSGQGYAATSLAQVARAARVSKALILWHFESKEHLFRAALQRFLAPYEIDAQVLLGLTESEQVEKLIDDYYDFIAEHLPSVQFVLGQVVRRDENSHELVARVRELYRVYRELLTTILERGRASRVFSQHVRPAEDAALIMAALNGLLVQQLVEPEGGLSAEGLRTRFKSAICARLRSSQPEDVPAPLVAGALPREALAQRTGR